MLVLVNISSHKHNKTKQEEDNNEKHLAKLEKPTSTPAAVSLKEIMSKDNLPLDFFFFIKRTHLSNSSFL